MKKKLKLSEIEIESFVTSIPNADLIEGGGTDQTGCTNVWCTTCWNCLSVLSYSCCSEAACPTATCPSHSPCTACGGVGCFLDGTLVNTDLNSYIKIEKLKVGDKVLSRNEKTGKLELNKIVDLFVTKQPSYKILNKEIKTTDYHPFLVNGEWKEVRYLKIGDKLKDNNENDIILNSMETVNKEVKVYNIEVEKANTYYVHNILVHNKKKANPAQPGGGSEQPITGAICGGALT